MKRALVSPLLSLFMPGMGQLMNRQPVKGGLMVAAVSLLFIVTLGLVFYQTSQAIMAMGELPPGTDKWAALHGQLLSQGFVWVLVMAGLYLAVLIWAVLDAWRMGKALDAQQAGGEGSN